MFGQYIDELIALIKEFKSKPALVNAFFDLTEQVLCAVGLDESSAGDGKRFMITMPEDTYVRLSLTIGDKRIVALIKQDHEPRLLFLHEDQQVADGRKDVVKWWIDFKDGTAPFHTDDPALLLPGGELRYGWMRAALNTAETGGSVRIEYGRHRPEVYLAAVNPGFRAQVLREAGL